ncbi:MAG: L-fucose:H+ symporter permease [Prevotella sp.]|nr:L-fucose:H+ symporter permease [Prevotella sp.]
MNKVKEELISLGNSINLVSFILITICFALWGFTNDITGVMVSAFSKIFQLNTMEGGLINVANSLGYLVFAIPAAMFMMRNTFKSGVMFSLGLYALGIMLLLPARMVGEFWGFLMAYFIMTCGSAAVETCCHPLIYNLGKESTGIIRLNLAQAFNSLGAVVGIFVATDYIQSSLSSASAETRAEMPAIQEHVLRMHDLDIVISPYLILVMIIALLIVFIRITKMPASHDERNDEKPKEAFRKLLKIRNYREGIIAEFFYIGAQICCLTFLIVYARRVFTDEGMYVSDIDVLIKKYSLLTIILYAVMRFACTALLVYFKPGRLLSVMGIIATGAILGAIIFTDRNGLYCIVIACAAMSLMFPTIYGIALRGLGTDIKYASAGLTMTVFAGAVFPTLQAAIIDLDISLFGLPAVNWSFIVPLACFAVVAVYGHRGYIRHSITHDYVS